VQNYWIVGESRFSSDRELRSPPKGDEIPRDWILAIPPKLTDRDIGEKEGKRAAQDPVAGEWIRLRVKQRLPADFHLSERHPRNRAPQ
jgi:hypothetical protein